MALETQTRPRQANKPLVKAWWSLALLLPALVAAFLVGEAIPAWMGVADTSEGLTPWWVMLTALVAATAVLASPLLLTSFYSRRASRAGEARAWWPVMAGGIFVVGFAAMNVASGILVLIMQ